MEPTNDVVAAAIAAERERCAKVAEAFAEKMEASKEGSLGKEFSTETWIAGAALRIAARIREQP